MNTLLDSLPATPELSDDDVAEFQRLMKEEAGVDLSPGEARLRAQDLIRLMTVIARPSKPATEEPAPVALKQLEHWDHLLGTLQTFSQSLLQIRSHSKDWVWPLREARALLVEVFALWILEAVKANPWQTLGYDPLLVPLPKLFDDLRDRVRPELPLRTAGVVALLERLNHEANMMTMGGWDLLSRDLPRLLLDVVLVTRVGLFPATSICPPAYTQTIERELESLDHRLLLLEAEGQEKLARPPR